jgi:hypothetical protein
VLNELTELISQFEKEEKAARFKLQGGRRRIINY